MKNILVFFCALCPSLLISQCEIFPTALGNYICDDNGTPGDPTDDTFTFELTMGGEEIGSSYTVSWLGNNQSGTYGVPVVVGPINLSDAPLSVGISDGANPNCTYILNLDPGPNCDNIICAVVASFDNYICDDGGTPTDPTDDTFTVDLTVTGINTSSGWIATGFFDASGPYGTQTFGPFSVYTAVTGIQVTDQLNSNCFDFATLFSPGACSNGCIFDNVLVTDVVCDDNGTPNDPSDDVIVITIFPLGDNLAAGYTITTDVGTISGTSGLNNEFTDFEISDFLPAEVITVTVIDDDDPTCTFDFDVAVPDGCGEAVCSLDDAGLISFECNPAAPGLPSDDFIDFIINPTGTNLGSGFTVTSPSGVISPGFGTYGVDNSQSISAISVNPGDPIFITITDNDDPNCSITFEIENITPCEEECNITGVNLSGLECFTNGTSTPDDDVYLFFVNVEGTGLGSGWTADDPFNNFGSYNQLDQFGPFQISDGTLTITITDNDNPNCTFTFDVTPPPPCSSECIIEAEVTDIICDDNGTPNDPTDDIYFFDVLVTGDGNSWIATDPLTTVGNYNEVTTFGPYLINGDATFFIVDASDPTCTVEVTVVPPPTCSTAECDIDAFTFNIICDNNGTPNDPTDDTFSFEGLIQGVNTGDSWTANDPLNTTGLYDQNWFFGPYPISAGNISFTITDIDNPNCTVDISVDAPPPCSVPICDIEANATNIICDDNGTPTDPADDTFTFEVIVTGNNTGASWNADDLLNTSGNYGQITIFGPYLITNGNVSVTITDVDDPSCTFFLDVNAPATCSDAVCDIEANETNIICDDNGTPDDPADDTFTFEVFVTGNNTGASWNADDPLNTSGNYGQITIFGPYLITDGNVSFTITDVDDPSCTFFLDVNAPAACSTELCDIEALISSVLCDDNDTPNDPLDDTFTFEVLVQGTNTGASWTADDLASTIGIYGQNVLFGPYPISGGSVSFTITDIDDATCTTDITVEAPPTCSPPGCEISATVADAICNDNGTPNDPSDDTFTFEVIVSGSNTGATWTADDPLNTSASYGANILFGPYPISGGSVSFTITDIDDATCTTDITVEAPPTCSPPGCEISATVAEAICNDNGTPNDPSDDTFTFEVIVSGSNTGATWTADDPLNTTASYGANILFGPYPISGGSVSFTISDIDDATCTTDITVEAPPTCSPPGCEISASVADAICDDNGTPNDPSDDTFTFEVIVNGSNTGATWTADDPLNTTASYGANILFGPYPISGGSVSFTISDIDDATCTTDITVEAPPTCSPPGCEISATVADAICDDNGTPNDPSDDTFTFEVLVSGSNTGAAWTADDPLNTTASYGANILFGPYPISGGSVSFTITDVDDTDCDTQIDIDPPSTCSDCPQIDTTFIDEVSCRMNFVPVNIIELNTIDGCDSIVSITTQYQPLQNEVDTLLCQGDFWFGQIEILNDTTIVDTLLIADCDVITTFDIQVKTPEFERIDVELCEGESIAIENIVFDEENTSGVIVVADQFGCDSLIQEIEVTFRAFDIELFISDVICFEEENGQIEISGSTNPPLSVTLNNSNFTVESLPFTIDRLGADFYELIIADEFGCERMFDFEVSEGELVTVNLEGELLENTLDTILLQANTNLETGTYNWSSLESDTTCVDCPSLLTAFASMFVYGVEVSSSLGCSAADEFSLLVIDVPEIDIPNIFSPNGDNLNDFFTIPNNYPTIIESLELSVYDRWGNLVFREESADEVSWNGRWNDQELRPGVFVYTLRVILFEGVEELRKGDVTIVR